MDLAACLGSRELTYAICKSLWFMAYKELYDINTAQPRGDCC